jgi:hypothetical protein
VVECGPLASECLQLGSVDQHEEVVELLELKHAYTLSGIVEDYPERQLSLNLNLLQLTVCLSPPDSLPVSHEYESSAVADPECLALPKHGPTHVHREYASSWASQLPYPCPFFTSHLP